MNVPSHRPNCLRWSVGIAGGLLAVAALAFPPAPHHLIYGIVRDEKGDPLRASGAEVVLEADGAQPVRTTITEISETPINYRLQVPLDSGTVGGLYKPTALHPAVPFRLKVTIGSTVYLPIEMTGASRLVATPGESTRLDLTLGVDSDGDGLPDAWEQALIAALGGGRSLADIRPGDDSDGDGMTNLQEYLAGTYAFDPADGFTLSIIGADSGGSLLEFTAIRGRTYAVESSLDFHTWVPVPFSVPAEGAAGTAHQSYTATDVRVLRIRVPTIGTGDPLGDSGDLPQFFKLVLR